MLQSETTSRNKPVNQFTPVPVYDFLQVRKALASIMIEDNQPTSIIQRKTGLSRPTISLIRKGEGNVSTTLALHLKKSESNKLTLGIHSILDGTLTPQKIDKASLQQGVTSAAILIEKRQLIEGLPTQHVTYSDHVNQEQAARQRKAELEAEELALTGGVFQRKQVKGP